MRKITIYQILCRVFGNGNSNNKPNGSIYENGCGKMNGISNKALKEIKNMGITHIWFTGLIAHASKTDYSNYGIPSSHHNTVKGVAGSPYAIRDYYDINPDLAESIPDRMKEFENLVGRVHKMGLKMIIDFVPNHVAREYRSINKPAQISDLGANDDTGKSFHPNNNFYYIVDQALSGPIEWGDYNEKPAKATGNDKFTSSPNYYDWYETVKINYGVDYENNFSEHFNPIPDTWKKMKDILSFWASKGVDGFRCDMAEMVPIQFWEYSIKFIKRKYPHIQFIAEIYNPGSLSKYVSIANFDFIYDKVSLYDTLRAVTCGNDSATAITRCWQRTGDVGNNLLHFMENHDEQRIASSFFADSAEKGRPSMIVSACFDTCPVMIYSGQELGERGMESEGFSGCDGRTSIFDYWSVDTLQRWYNNGKFNYTLLTKEEKELRNFYSLLLKICTTEKSISRGKFFDLMYVNPYSSEFNPHKYYAFFRSFGKELILIVVNFDDKSSMVSIFIPEHAFDYLAIKRGGKRKAIELISGLEEEIILLPDATLTTKVPANNGIILKIL